MTLVHTIIIGILQGVSELFPVSSLGHAVLIPSILRWGIDQKSESWLAFLVALHVGTAIALLIYFRDDWVSVVKAFVRSVQQGQMGSDHDERLAWMVVLGTIPTGVVGLVLQAPLRSLFASPYAAACFLIVNGAIMFVGERFLQRQLAERAEASTADAMAYRQQAAGGAGFVPSSSTNMTGGSASRDDPEIGRYRDITQLSWRDAAIIGLAQIGALLPGISRSGVTMVAGLMAGLTHEASARYTFLLATPIIGAAAALELPKLFDSGGRSILGYAVLGMVLAGIAAYFSVRYLMRYFESGRLYPFAYYCVGAGVLGLILLAV
ncbi:MAG TPA: undecaprenyl-diphosphate phosphatase [Chloroflexota bacterium]|jgi:undecaprenyl-diphosphatase